MLTLWGPECGGPLGGKGDGPGLLERPKEGGRLLLENGNILQVRGREGSFFEIADSIAKRLSNQRDLLADNEMQDAYNDVQVMTVSSRAFHARFAPMSNAYGPTPAQRESLSIARSTYDDVVAELDEIVNVEYAALKTALDTAKVPWTPGRGIQR